MAAAANSLPELGAVLSSIATTSLSPASSSSVGPSSARAYSSTAAKVTRRRLDFARRRKSPALVIVVSGEPSPAGEPVPVLVLVGVSAPSRVVAVVLIAGPMEASKDDSKSKGSGPVFLTFPGFPACGGITASFSPPSPPAVEPPPAETSDATPPWTSGGLRKPWMFALPQAFALASIRLRQQTHREGARRGVETIEVPARIGAAGELCGFGFSVSAPGCRGGGVAELALYCHRVDVVAQQGAENFENVLTSCVVVGCVLLRA
eukprot:CAMPEP_0181395116 /NCGR_PEP_ID=MMETSP1106-20121128/28160_1 /TAXON_ID=81844 /ORGANISM="Mantoniella antarctica, Strain SL-175" /LENGTH=262 /DNA_ID=CAMNT_0023516699 /DNA_START=484 /DNA_END=1272 /DNA_ORIENTATION=+